MMHAISSTTVFAAVCSAALASPFTYQGTLHENGQPANGTYDMVFQLADAPVLGFLLDSDAVNNVEVVDGLFTVEIDFDDDLMNNDNRWLAIVVEGTSLSPRTRLRPTPRAYNAVRANAAGSLEAPAFMSATNATLNALATSSTGTALLGTHTSSSGTAAGIHGKSNSTSIGAIGILGEIDPTSPGGLSSGVRGINNGTGGSGIGVYGSQDGSGWGVYGTTPSGRGVYGQSDTGTGMYARTVSGSGLFAVHSTAGTQATLANEDHAVAAFNTDTEGEGTAIYAEGGKIGIDAYARPEGFGLDLTRIGVRSFAGGTSTGANMIYGVQSFAANPIGGGGRTAYGVYGGAQVGNGSNTAYGIFGESIGPGSNQFAGFFQGDVHVQGTLSKSSGSFKIDHPLQPESMYLSHSFVESPEMLNIYSGVIVLDENGAAVIELPSYFESLNRSFRYQLTPMGAPMPELYVSSEVSANEFAIEGGKAGMKVSWQLTGVRQDPAALAHPIVVEETKSEQHQGKYLNPAVYGHGNERAIHPSPDRN